MRVYSGVCSPAQLQKFFLLAMGVRFEEIQREWPEASSELIYAPTGRSNRKRGWHVRLGDYFDYKRHIDGIIFKHNLSVPGKVSRISQFHPRMIMWIGKMSASGNILTVQRDFPDFGTLEWRFSVRISQCAAKTPCWVDFCRLAGIALTSEERPL